MSRLAHLLELLEGVGWVQDRDLGLDLSKDVNRVGMELWFWMKWC